ncbi:MAG: TVP38/TMEM64 family protein [Anaerolineae bacterium]|nr:TVP38/TMEM64 family protein [Anaerolineae bacterium]
MLTWVTLIVAFGVAIAAVFHVARHQEAVTELVRSLGFAGPLVIIALYLLLGVSPIPADPLTVINGAVFGPIWGGVIAWIGTTLAALIEYFLGTRIGNAADFENSRRDLPYGLGELPVDSILFLLGGRMLTGAGSKVVSYLSGIYRVSLWRYLWTTGLAMLLGTILFALGGFGLLRLF